MNSLSKIMRQHVSVILASGSPRRKELFSRAGLIFSVHISNCDESTELTDPEALVAELSLRKARAVANELQEAKQGSDPTGALLVSADTVVALDNRVLGKPADEAEALAMLNELSGRTHRVLTGVTTLYRSSRKTTFHPCFSFTDQTRVTMYPFTQDEALAYIATGEPMDKAGSYGIQGIGGRLVEKIEGSYDNVVGFPLPRFLRELISREMITFETSGS